jgi:hypothetical protein
MEVWEHTQVNTLRYQENEFGWVNVLQYRTLFV